MNNGIESALLVARVADLPPAIDDDYKKYWIKAIVKIQRSNGDTGYCIAVNDGSDRPRIIRDFNPTGIIAGILSIHPYEESERGIIPHFTSGRQILKYLCKYGYNPAEIEALLSTENKTTAQLAVDKAILKGYVTQVAAKQAMIKSESDEQARQLAAMADAKLKEKKTKERKYGRTAKPKTKRSKGKD